MSSKSLKERFREIGAIELLQDTTWRLAEECDSGELIDRFAKLAHLAREMLRVLDLTTQDRDFLRQRCTVLFDALENMVRQHCWLLDHPGEFDSCSLTSDANAMRLLAKVGRFRITTECGKRVIGQFEDRS